ncbi:hypothetical protein K432DRAFT_405826 [Lepidopterella palustris CBS 459.81]|uniref:DUF8040 domain-containing protein n=1 Tax=Lepidopterella palustris CBS 459.81 TaxID=1314670 RepID=A0A8E2E8S2_9PEZI|nr:hypothetical protein K432DRAFT_405826 [Lepidopterella palustris CBS 459.81]
MSRSYVPGGSQGINPAVLETTSAQIPMLTLREELLQAQHTQFQAADLGREELIREAQQLRKSIEASQTRLREIEDLLNLSATLQYEGSSTTPKVRSPLGGLPYVQRIIQRHQNAQESAQKQPMLEQPCLKRKRMATATFGVGSTTRGSTYTAWRDPEQPVLNHPENSSPGYHSIISAQAMATRAIEAAGLQDNNNDTISVQSETGSDSLDEAMGSDSSPYFDLQDWAADRGIAPLDPVRDPDRTRQHHQNFTQDLIRNTPSRFPGYGRMEVWQFKALNKWCCKHTNLSKSGHLTRQEKLLAFLYMVGSDTRLEIIASFWSCSPDQAKCIFAEVMDALLILHSKSQLSKAPHFKVYMSKWQVLGWDSDDKKTREAILKPGRAQRYGCSQEDLFKVLTALNIWIVTCRKPPP